MTYIIVKKSYWYTKLFSIVFIFQYNGAIHTVRATEGSYRRFSLQKRISLLVCRGVMCGIGKRFWMKVDTCIILRGWTIGIVIKC